MGCPYCLACRQCDACLHLSWSGWEQPFLIGFNVCALPLGKVLSCLVASMVATHYGCIGCSTSGMISFAQILLCL